MNPSASSSPPVIDMQNVAVAAMHDPQTIVLEDVNWTVAAGEFWAVAGLHRSGKSDLLMLAAGLMPPRSGCYRLWGEPMPIVEEARLPTRLRLGLVFDGGRLFPSLTVAENVALPVRYHCDWPDAEIAARVRAVLELTGTSALADARPGAMPRAWHQRVGLARALVLRPEALLVDNPLGGLDPRHRAWWLEFLSHLAAGHPFWGGRPVTLVVTDADLRPWRECAQRFAVITDRRWRVIGSRADLAASPEPFVRELLTGAGPRVPARTES